MCQHADQMGANAIIGVRYDATEVMQSVTEVLCYGTAVVVEDQSESQGAVSLDRAGRLVRLWVANREKRMNMTRTGSVAAITRTARPSPPFLPSSASRAALSESPSG